MTLQLPVDELYLEMLERIEDERGDTKADLAAAVEGIIHENYQQIRTDEP